MFLLDTSVVSELRKVGDGRADAGVAAWISGDDAASFYISALTLISTLHDYAAKHSVSTMRWILSGGTLSLSYSVTRPLRA